MQFLAVPRAISAVLLGGTLVSFLPAVESPSSTAPIESLGTDAAIRSLASFAAESAADPQRQVAVAQLETKPKDYVKAKVYLSQDKLAAGGKVKFAVLLDVQKGWHINANPPQPENMIPTKVTVLAKQKSKQLGTQYPEGAELKVMDIDEAVLVYEGEVVIRGEIQGAADGAGKTEELEFQVKYQACNEKNCLPPKTLKLGGKIDIVKPGTPIKKINPKYFPEDE